MEEDGPENRLSLLTAIESTALRATTISPDLIKAFASIVGEAHALTRAEDQAGYLREWRDRYVGSTPVVLRPGSTEEVAQILRLASEHAVGIVPQGGNTGLVGGQIPSTDGSELVLSLGRLNRIRDVDADGGVLIAEAGVTLTAVQTAAANVQRLFPLSLASEGSAMVGGVLSTNAGGTAVLAYGNARNLCLGLEAVFADGRIWHGLKRLKKDNTGYDLRDLLIGSEGTLGIITAASLKLFPAPADRQTAIVALNSPDAALQLFRFIEDEAGPSLTAFELWSQRAAEFAVSYMPGTRNPFTASHPWAALVEISHSSARHSPDVLETILSAASERGLISDAVIAASLDQAQDFWRLRESFSEAQKGAGGSIKHDISVPISSIPRFLKEADAAVERLCPGARSVPFGHFGDGNLHYNVSQPIGMDKAGFLALWTPMQKAVHDLVAKFDGSISAEHGIGQMKRETLIEYKSPVEIDVMRAIKAALDPKGILNPGKVL